VVNSSAETLEEFLATFNDTIPKVQLDTPESRARRHHLEKLNIIYSSGRNVAVVLKDRENFFIDLPYLDCVLPSMKAGEPYFVPAFIHKVLLPSWNGLRSDKTDPWFEDEQFIIGVTKEYFYPALNEYLKLLCYACYLEIEFPLNEISIQHSSKIPLLSEFLLKYVGVDAEKIVSFSSDINFDLGFRIIYNCPYKLSALIMIATQWGLDTRKIVNHIKVIFDIVKGTLRHDLAEIFQMFLRTFAGKPVLPKLQPSSVSSIFWTMNPEYTMKLSDEGDVMLVQTNRPNWRTVYDPPPTYDRTKYNDIKQVLLAQLFSIDDPKSIFIAPKAEIAYEKEPASISQSAFCKEMESDAIKVVDEQFFDNKTELDDLD
jgi:hypothetical protein